MKFWLILIPLFSALLGWLFSRVLLKMLFFPRLPKKWMGFYWQGIIPKRQLEIAVILGNAINREFVPSGEIEEKILDPELLEQIIPEIELHIDNFLRVKLKEAIPMVAMFVGDKTIVQLKEVFMAEMKMLFPEVMRSYVKKLQKDLDIGEKITARLKAIPAQKIEILILQTFSTELRYIQIAGIFFGFIIGVLQLITILLLLK